VNSAQVSFVVTSWLFIILAALLFLVPTDFPSSEGAAWTCLGVGIASHLALLAAIIFDQFPGKTDSPVSEG
jgi:hypothetical protein